jgi:hypothetical protein
MKLSQTRADKIKAPGRYGDGRGLYLQITAAGNRSWIFRYERGGHERMMGLGPCADFTLDEVREFARSARRKLKDGTDPIDDRRAVAAKAAEAVAAADAKAITFARAADAFFEMHQAKWTNKRHRAQFHSRFDEYVFPVIGSLPVAAIDKTLILKVVQPIWKSKNPTAARTLRLIKGVLDFAKVSGWRDGDNPAVWAGNLEQ